MQTKEYTMSRLSPVSWSVEQNARETQMTTRMTEGARRERHEKRESFVFLVRLPPSFLACSRARALLSRSN